MTRPRPTTSNRYQPIVKTICKAEGWPEPEAELALVPGRRFRCDLVWRESRLIVEVQGGVWTGGRHSRGTGQLRDFEKFNALTLDGWRVLQVSPRQVQDGTLQRLLAQWFSARRDEVGR